MSTLNDNLLQIYNTKLEIKDAIGTNSDVFEDYPSYIRNLRGITWEDVIDAGYTYTSGTYVVGLNGNYDITSYNNVWVNVPTGGSVSGTYTITNDGLYDISSYAYVNVQAEPNLLVNAWSGDTVDASAGDLVYEDIDNLLQQPLLYNLQATVDSIDSIIGAQWTSVITPGEWLDCDKNEGVKVYIDENASVGGYESSTGWLRIIFSTPANGLIRIKFSGTASNGYHTQESFDTNWITFEFYRGA